MQLVYESPSSIKRPVPKAILEQAASAAALQRQQAAPQRPTTSNNYASSSFSSGSSQQQQQQQKGGMWGYGNPNYTEAPPSVLDKMRDRVSETISSMGDSKPSLPANYKGNYNYSSSGGGVQQRNGSSDSYAAAKNATLNFDDAPERRTGDIGGGWGQAQSSSAAPPRPVYEARTYSGTAEPRSPVVSQARTSASVTEPSASDMYAAFLFLCLSSSEFKCYTPLPVPGIKKDCWWTR